jgi:predicted transcriptional regulator
MMPTWTTVTMSGWITSTNIMRDHRQDILDLLKSGPKSITTLTASHLGAALNLKREGLIEEAGIGRDGRMRYSLTDKGK